MAVEESVHYDIHSLASSYEWNEQNPGGTASVRIGPDYHVAALSMSHQLHCLESFKDELRDGFSQNGSWAHIEHCSNYMRQWSMCRADLTLEPGDFMQRDFDWDRQGVTHECLDLQAIYKELSLNWQSWVSLWKKHHLYMYAHSIFFLHIKFGLMYYCRYDHQSLNIHDILTSAK